MLGYNRQEFLPKSSNHLSRIESASIVRVDRGNHLSDIGGSVGKQHTRSCLVFDPKHVGCCEIDSHSIFRKFQRRGFGDYLID